MKADEDTPRGKEAEDHPPSDSIYRRPQRARTKGWGGEAKVSFWGDGFTTR